MNYAEEYLDFMDSFIENLRERVLNLIEKKGAESRFYSEKSLQIKEDDFMFNLDGERYLYEIKESNDGEIELIDNRGYSYDYYVLEIKDFLRVIDHLIEIYED